MSATLSYVFCLLRSARRPTLRGISEGMPGGDELRAIEVGDGVWAVVQSVPEAEYGEAALARGLQDLNWVGPRAVAHERVIESFLSATALLPMQLFTLFTSDDRVAEHVRSDRARIGRILKRVEKKVEWGLRLTWNEKEAREKALKRPARTGTEFLARKRDVLDVSRRRLAAARTAATRVYKAIDRQAAASQRRTTLERAAPGSRLLLDAAFLVPVARSGAFRTAIREQARALRGTGIETSLTGPWPAYNFIQ
ncbi:MAG TPA: GvpL/GvpF family gas vesicle protein [Vicinamibacterales bacterium]|nr:GvpL/GvpF family gas vesicle protein [Vicinamibacterales bacterium]